MRHNVAVHYSFLIFWPPRFHTRELARICRVVGNAGFDIMANMGLYANFTYMYKDGFPITSDGVNNTTSYSLLNAKLGFQHSLGKHFDINAAIGVTNITNTKYPIMVFVNQLPDAFIAAPRDANYFGSLNLKYNF